MMVVVVMVVVVGEGVDVEGKERKHDTGCVKGCVVVFVVWSTKDATL